MTQRSSSFELAIKIAKQKEQLALTTLAKVQQNLKHAKEQVINLQKYKQDYCAHLTGQSQAKSAALIHDYQAFISKIDDLIDTEHQQVTKFQNDAEQLTAQWQARRTSLLALEKVVERDQDAEQLLNEVLEQADADERSQYRAIAEQGVI